MCPFLAPKQGGVPLFGEAPAPKSRCEAPIERKIPAAVQSSIRNSRQSSPWYYNYFSAGPHTLGPQKNIGKWTKWVYPPLFQTKVGGGKMQTSSPPVITPNRSQSNPDDMITLPRPIQSVGMDLHDVSGTSTGQTLPRERRAPPGTHFCPTIWWVYPHSATIFILHPLLSTFSSTFVRNIKQQLQGSCARVRGIQTPAVVTICGWSAAGRRPIPGLQQ